MAGKKFNTISAMSDDAIIQTIGDFVRHHRLHQNITQKELAYKAGINRTTLSDLELGRRTQLITLIQVLRILNKLYVLNAFEITEQTSPIKLAEMEMKKRKKASGFSADSPIQKSDW